MCKGMKKCHSCASKSIGKMAKRKAKVTRRRRRVGKISYGETKNTGMDILYTLGGVLVSKLVKYGVSKASTTAPTGVMKYADTIVSVVGGGIAAMSKTPAVRKMGLAVAATGVYDGLSKADILPAAMKGIGAPRLGYPNRLGAMPSPMEMEMDMVHG